MPFEKKNFLFLISVPYLHCDCINSERLNVVNSLLFIFWLNTLKIYWPNDKRKKCEWKLEVVCTRNNLPLRQNTNAYSEIK